MPVSDNKLSIRFIKEYTIEPELAPWRRDLCVCGRWFLSQGTYNASAFKQHQRWCWRAWLFRLKGWL